MKKLFHIEGVNNFIFEICFNKTLSRNKLSEDEIQILVKIIKELDCTELDCETSAAKGEDDEF